MKKIMLLAVCGMFFYILPAQQTKTIGGFPSGTINRGDTITVTLFNQGANPATFFVPDPHPGREAVTYSDSSLIHYLHSIAAQHADLEDQREAVADTLAIIIKSEMVVHQQSVFDAWNADTFDAVYAKKNAAMGAFHGQSSRKCGDQCELFTSILMKTGLFVTNDIQSVGLDTLHTLVQVMIKARYKLYDLDTNEPFLTIPFSGSPNGCANADDVKNNVDLIDAAPYFYSKTHWGDSIRLNLKNRGNYKQVWISNTPHYYIPAHYPQTQELGGWITLCSSCTMEFTYVIPYCMDVTKSEGSAAYERFIAFKDSLTNGIPGYRDSMLLLTQDYFGVNASEAQSILGSHKPYIKTSSRFLITSTTEVLTAEIKIPAGTTSITENELHFPGFILGVEGNAISVPGNYLESSYKTELWDDNTPQVMNKNVHYLTDEFIAASQNETRIKVSYNPRLYDFLNGFKIDNLGMLDTLLVTKKINGNEVVETAIQKSIASDTKTSIYPNPSNGTFFISSEAGETVTVTNVLGEHVKTISLQNGKTEIFLLESGTYFIKKGADVQKIIVQ